MIGSLSIYYSTYKMTLLERLNHIPDPRNDINVKHDLVDVVFLVFPAVHSGARAWKSIQEFGESQIGWVETISRI